MNRLLALPCALVIAFAASCTPPEAPTTLEGQMRKTFKELKQIGMMKPAKVYAVTVDGKPEEGRKEQFLRRRDATEIWESKLSTGCGDYSLAFIQKISAYGVTTLLIDAAELSQRSLDSRFAGHSVVAVKSAAEESVWWLVDPTSRRVLSRNWNRNAKRFEANGKQFWIGYCGPVEAYPVHGPQDLRDFYDQTLNRVPREILDRIETGD